LEHLSVGSSCFRPPKAAPLQKNCSMMPPEAILLQLTEKQNLSFSGTVSSSEV
jgi:hypothetical protein